MRSTLRIAALLATFLLPLPFAPGRAAAQDPCEQLGTCASPPTVLVMPRDSTWSGSTEITELPVTIEWCDREGLNGASRSITLDGTLVTSSFDYVLVDPTEECAMHALSRATLTLSAGQHRLVARISNSSGLAGTDSATYTYSVDAPPPPPPPGSPPQLVITPDWREVQRAAGQPATEHFLLTNIGGQTGAYDVWASCSGGVNACSAARTWVVLPPGGSASVGLNYRTANLVGLAGTIRLDALLSETGVPAPPPIGATPSATGRYSVSIVALPAAGMVGDVGDGSTFDRERCVTASAGDGAAYECADLRLVHPLPAVRLLNRSWAPALIYNSQHAHPFPLVGASYSPPAANGTPQTITLTLRLATAPGTYRNASRTFTGWAPGTTKRITVGVSASDLATGLYAYTLSATNSYADGSTTTVALGSGAVPVVNRRGVYSKFGPGWWLAGLEQLVPLAGGDRLWVGGDGSTRVYRPLTDTTWVAAPFERPDTLVLRGGYYVRTLPGRVEVRFDNAGQHVETVNRLGQTTRFVWWDGKLDRIELPKAGYAYRFEYQPWPVLLTAVASPGPEGERFTRLVPDVWGRLERIDDPDVRSVRFGFDGMTSRVTRRTDRLGYLTEFRYGQGERLGSVKLHLGAPGASDSIVTRFRPQETQGMADSSAAVLAQVYTRLDGPRLDAGDTTALYLDRRGAPVRVRNALGQETYLTRGDPRWPALVTRVQHPGGREVSATYDARGNVASVTDWSLLSGGRVSTTLYEWDPFWDAVTTVTAPEGEATHRAYNATGELDWVQPGADSARRVRFSYHPLGDPNAPGLVSAVTHPRNAGQAAAPVEQYAYDARGNLSAAVTPLGFRTHFFSDAAGRDTLVVTPVQDTLTARERRRYDVMDRDTLVESIGPALFYRQGLRTALVGEERVTVRKFYDAEGQLDSLARFATPDTARVGVLTTRWLRDGAGRVVREVAPDGRRDSTVYNPAGNAVRRVTRRDHAIELEYDALNRLTRRLTRQVVVYGPVGDEQLGWTFPLYPNDAAGGWTIPADTAVFGYDVAGNLTVANNRDAQVSREFLPSGLLRTETQRIRTYNGNDYSTHVYTLTHSYDLNGRRVRLRHPQNLAPSSLGGTFVADTSRWFYDELGRLKLVTDPLNNWWELFYTHQGQLDSLAHPGGIGEKYAYDLDGRLVRRVERTTQPYTRPGGALSTELHRELFTHDARGKVLSVSTWSDTTSLAYSGLGNLVYRRSEDRRFFGLTEERYITDALGNQRFMARSGPTGTDLKPHRDSANYRYQPGAGRLLSARGSQVIEEIYHEGAQYDTTGYDAAGNKEFFGSETAVTGGAFRERALFYYDAEDRLRLVDRRTCKYELVGSTVQCNLNKAVAFPQRGAFEEYRYDALGRRVLVRTRTQWTCSANDCDQSVKRIVWDGDQILYEIRYPAGGGGGAPLASIEQDTGFAAVAANPNGDGFAPYGRVAYTHGPGIDDPLGLVRQNFSAYWPGPMSIALHRNWRGLVDRGSFDDGRLERCADPDPANWHTCVRVDWPAPLTFAGHRQVGSTVTAPFGWVGSLADSKRDASGQLYMRNRYYDPNTGRFTQEDPIGLAGGLNVYGFAAGDPISYDDPFGLCPWWMPAYSAGCLLWDLGSVLANGPSLPEVHPSSGIAGSAAGMDPTMLVASVIAGAPARGLPRGAAGLSRRAPGLNPGGIGYHSFSAFKRAHGPAGARMQWHHIVEQTRGNIQRFGAHRIHNTNNLVRVDENIHRQISGFYSSRQGFTNGMTVRQWLSTQSYEAQQEFGLQVMRRFGATR